jgi:SAM-dependent methyltransferase
MPTLNAAHAGAVALIRERTGLEVGGPSGIFARRGLLPIYPHAARVDNCNFGSDTVCARQAEERDTFQYDRRREPGRQFFSEAAALTFASSGTYDFVLSSHTLAHSANPLKCLHEWQRVLKPDGAIVLVLPHKDGNFDHWRPVTPLQHLIEDFERQIGEDDLTHLPEILALHDLSLDPEAVSAEQFEARSRKNFENRCLHQHVFDTQRAIELVDYSGLQIQSVAPVAPADIILVAVKTTQRSPDNGRFLCHGATHRRRSPFVSDRLPYGMWH